MFLLFLGMKKRCRKELFIARATLLFHFFTILLASHGSILDAFLICHIQALSLAQAQWQAMIRKLWQGLYYCNGDSRFSLNLFIKNVLNWFIKNFWSVGGKKKKKKYLHFLAEANVVGFKTPKWHIFCSSKRSTNWRCSSLRHQKYTF